MLRRLTLALAALALTPQPSLAQEQVELTAEGARDCAMVSVLLSQRVSDPEQSEALRLMALYYLGFMRGASAEPLVESIDREYLLGLFDRLLEVGAACETYNDEFRAERSAMTERLREIAGELRED